MRALVTGGAGFIGTHLVNLLVQEGHHVKVVDTRPLQERSVGGGTYHYVFDISNTDYLFKAMQGIDWVFHTAARPRVQDSIENPEPTWEANVEGTRSVLKAAQLAGVRRVVYSASSSAYGDQSEMPLKEHMLPNPMSPYAMHKLFGEHLCQQASMHYGLQTVCLRYFNVYGPGADPEGPYAQVIPKLIAMRLRGKALTITGDGTQTRDLVHVRDVARANLFAAISNCVGAGEVINIGSGRNVSINRIADLVGGPVAYIEKRHEPHDSVAHIRKAKELLGWNPQIFLEDGIRELKAKAGLQ